MLVSGRNNVKEIIRHNIGIKKIYLQNNFSDADILSLLNGKKIIYYDKKDLDNLVHNNHQGVVLEVDDYHYYQLDDIIHKDNCKIVILDHLEDTGNLGAIIRSVEAFGIDGIILPINRSVSINDTVMRTSVGTLFQVKICQVVNLNQTIKYLKNQGFWIYGADMAGEDYQKVNYASKSCLIIGNEGKGLTRIVRDACDYIVSIPMRGSVNSLNASVAAGILLSKITD